MISLESVAKLGPYSGPAVAYFGIFQLLQQGYIDGKDALIGFVAVGAMSLLYAVAVNRLTETDQLIRQNIAAMNGVTSALNTYTALSEAIKDLREITQNIKDN